MLLLSIDTLAAVVSDNDGAAFVTKAEFEALKTNFATQINNYNDSIDKKIDGAIASYLAGIQLSQPPTITYGKIKEIVGGDLWCKNIVNDVGEDEIETNTKLNLTRRLNYKYFNNLTQIWNIHVVKVAGDQWYTWVGSELVSTAHTMYYDGVYSLGFADIHGRHTPGGANADTTVTKYLPSTWVGWSPGSWTEIEYEVGLKGALNWNFSKNPLTTADKQTKNVLQVNNPGDGKVWLYHTNPDGSRTLREFAITFYPVQNVSVDAHTFKSFAEESDKSASSILNYYCIDNGLKDNTSLSITLPANTDYGTYDCSEARVADDSTENQSWWEYKISQLKATDNTDYSVYQWGKNSTTTIYCVEDVQQPILGDEATIGSDQTKSTFANIYFTPKFILQQKNDLSGVEVKYNKIKIVPRNFQLNQFTNSFLSSIAGEKVRIGGGLPLLEVPDLDQKNKIKLKFKCRDADGNDVSTDTVSYQISNKQFVDGHLNTVSGTIDYTHGVKSVSVGTEVEVDVEGVKGFVWLNMYSNTDGNDVSISDIQVTSY